MANYLLKFKGKYRILPELDLKTNDFPRDKNGEIAKEYDDLEEQGKFLKLPCAIGDKVFIIAKKDISKQTIKKITYKEANFIEIETNRRIISPFDFGKTVFFTCKEVEHALKEMEVEKE